MSDPARQGTLEAVNGPDPVSPTAPPPSWQTFAREGEWRRAQAAATLLPADGAVIAALSSLSTLQNDIRARRYAAARRSLAFYRDALTDVLGVSTGEGALLQHLAPPEILHGAIAALEAANGERDPASLPEKLHPATQHPLTKAEACNALGVVHALRGEIEAARDCFNEALRLDPGHYRSRMNLGNMALEAGQPAQAEAEYRAVLELAPDYDSALHNLGVALRRQGKLNESVKAIRRAQRLAMRRARQDSKDELDEQMRANPSLKWVRIAIFALIMLAVFWMMRSVGG